MTTSDITAQTLGSFADVPLRGEASAAEPTADDVTAAVDAAATANGYTADQLA